MPTKQNKYGVAGCGAMGLPMAQALLKSGFDVYGFDVRPTDQFGDFSNRMIADPQIFSNTCDIVICVVRDAKQILDLCFNDQAIFKAPHPPKTLIISSTVSPLFIKELREMLPSEVDLLDAPMSGGPQAAIARTLTFMVGGATEKIEALNPLFKAMGNKTFNLGDLSAGMTIKVLNNFVAATTVAAVRNVIAQADRLGVEKDLLLSVMDQSSGQTWFGSSFNQTEWAQEQYSKTNTIGILEKDVNAFIDALPNGAEPLHDAVITALKTLPPMPR